jgi:hypothetical protein
MCTYSLKMIAQNMENSTRERWQLCVLSLQTKNCSFMSSSILSPFSVSQSMMQQSLDNHLWTCDSSFYSNEYSHVTIYISTQSTTSIGG